jgi:hypothetical protein
LHRKLDILEALNRFDECLQLICSMESQSLNLLASPSKLLTLVKEFGCNDIFSQFYVTGKKLSSANISEDGLCFVEKMTDSIANRKSRIEYRLRSMR